MFHSQGSRTSLLVRCPGLLFLLGRMDGWREEGQASSGPRLEPAPQSPYIGLSFQASEQVLPLPLPVFHPNGSPSSSQPAQEMKVKGVPCQCENRAEVSTRGSPCGIRIHCIARHFRSNSYLSCPHFREEIMVWRG